MVFIKDFIEYNMEYFNVISYFINNKLCEEGSDGNYLFIIFIVFW